MTRYRQGVYIIKINNNSIRRSLKVVKAMRKTKSILILGVILLIACVDYAKEDLVLDSECYYCPETVTLLFPLNNETCEPGELIDDSRAIIKLFWKNRVIPIIMKCPLLICQVENLK